MTDHRPTWHHAPVHIFSPNTLYMVTAGTMYKQHFYKDPQRLKILQDTLFSVAEKRGWELRAWAVFSNHYHFIARSPDGNGAVGRLIQQLHSDSAKELNRVDSMPGRKVWFEYWDKCLTFEKSYYPRLNYVMKNPVHHGLVQVAHHYPFCSAGWFENISSSAFRRKVDSFGFDRLTEPDDYEPVGLVAESP